MPNYESTAVFRADISSLKKEMQAAGRAARLADAEFKAATAGMDDWSSSSDGLSAKLKQLDTVLASQRSKYETQKKILAETEAAYGKNSAAAEREKTALLNMEAAIKRTEADIQKYNTALSEVNRAADEAADGTKKYDSATDELTDKISEQESELEQLKKAYKDALLDENTESAEKYANEIRQASGDLAENKKRMQEAEQAADALDRSMDELGDGAGEAGDGFTILKGAVAGIAANVATKGIEMLADGLKKAAQEAIRVGSEFEAAMSKVSALSGARGSDFDRLSKKAQELGASTQFSATQVAEGFQYMSLAGWDANTSLSAIEGVLNLAASAEMDLAQASDMVTDYLSAFGMEASEAGKMADMLAFAQANSNTSAQQLGEAYGNSAATLHAAGQEIDTVTAILEGMANQGLKGSEAGTALNGVMSQITQKMKDGKIQIGETAIAVQDQSGNFRDLVDILADVEDATDGMGSAEKSAALAAVFNRTSLAGVNLVLNEGVDNIKDYKDALNDSEGAAADMADTMNDNLQGDVKALNSALEGLGIVTYDAFNGPIRGIVQFATDSISEMTKEIKPTESMLKSFAQEVQQSAEATEKTVSAARETVEDAEVNAAQLEMYKQILIESNGAADEFSKYQVKEIVSQLADTVPELAEAWDEESQSLKLTNDQIAQFIDKSADMMMVEAYQKAAQQSMDALAQAQIDQIKAQSGLKKAQQDYDAAELETVGTVQTHTQKSREATEALREAQKAQEDADNALQGAQEEYDLTVEALKQYGAGLDDVKESEEGAKEGVEEFNDAVAEVPEEDPFKEIREAAIQLEESVRTSMKGAVTAFDEFNGGAEIDADTILKNLDSQVKGLKNWAENMKKLGALAGSGMSQELYDYLVEMGPQSANLVQELVDTLEEDEPKFREISNKWGEAVKLSNQEAELIADAHSTGKAVAEADAEGLEDGSKEPIKKAQELSAHMKKKLDELAPDARIAGANAGTANAAGMESTKNKNKTAGGAVASAGVAGMGSQTGAAKSKGSATGSNYAAGVSSQTGPSKKSGTSLATAAASGMSSEGAKSSAASAGRSLGQRFYDAVKSKVNAAKKLLSDNSGGGNRTNPSNVTQGGDSSGASSSGARSSGVPNYMGGSVAPNAEPQAAKAKTNAVIKYAYDYGAEYARSYINGVTDQEKKLQTAVSNMVVNVVNTMKNVSKYDFDTAGENAASVFSDAFEKRIDYLQKRIEYQNDEQLEAIEKELKKLEESRDAAENSVEATEKKISTLKKNLETAKKQQKEYNSAKKGITKALDGSTEKKLTSRRDKLQNKKKRSSKEDKELKDIKERLSTIEKLKKTTKKYKSAADDVAKYDKQLSNAKKTKKIQEAELKTWKGMVEKQEAYKEQYQEASAATIDAFENALEQYQDKANDLIESTISGITEKYSEKYDALIDKQEDLISKLKSAGDLFDISGAGVMTVNDIKEQTKAITEYTDKLANIKKKVSGELFDAIADFDMKEGSAYIDRLLSMSAKDLEAYNKAYSEKMRAAEKAGDTIYKSEIQKVGKDYQTEIDKAFKNLPNQLKALGNEAMKGFVDGLGSDTDYMKTSVQTLINGMIAQFREGLDMHSPSRVMAELADNTMSGYAGELKTWLADLRSMAQKLAGTVSAPFAPGQLSGYGAIAGQIGGSVSNSSVINNYNLVQNNTSPKALTALETYQARRQQLSMIRALT